MTESYSVLIHSSAKRTLRRIPTKDAQRIWQRVIALADDPRPPGCEKLEGLDFYRIRQGDYRILYNIEDKERTVEVIRIGHRREVY